MRATIEELDTPTRGRVRLTGWIDDDERDRLLASARVLAYPSLDEGFGLPMLEAWQHDVPVVAARAGALPEVAVDAALLVDPLDVDALAGALQRALDDDAARRELVDHGRVRLATFSWDRTAEGIAAIYRRGDAERTRMITVLAGGVGAARFLSGLVQVRPASEITAIVNTGDDVVLHGLHISPDLDTVTYTLAGAINPETGWGLVGETWSAMDALQRYGDVRPLASSAGATWFRLGDRDLATHLYRTHRLAEGASLSEVTAEIAAAWGLALRVLPMSDDRVETRVDRRRRGRGRVPGVLRRAPAQRGRGGHPPRRRRRARPGSGRARRARRRVDDRHRALEPDRVDRPDPVGRRACATQSPTAATTSSRCRPSSREPR